MLKTFDILLKLLILMYKGNTQALIVTVFLSTSCLTTHLNKVNKMHVQTHAQLFGHDGGVVHADDEHVIK